MFITERPWTSAAQPCQYSWYIGVGHRLGSRAVSWCNHSSNLRNVILRLSFHRIRLQILVSKVDSDIQKQALTDLIDNIFAITYTIVNG
jgi:hypothetical protein